MNQLRKAKILIGALLLCGFVTTSTACYGPFALTKKLHTWNGTLGNKWVNELVFFALFVIPAYGLCTLGDALIFNSIEFWTGSNPISDGSLDKVKTERLADGSLQVEKGGQVYLVQMDPATHGAILKHDGKVVVTAERTATGDVAIHDLANGRTSVVSAKDAQTLSETSQLVAALSLQN